MKHLTAMTPPLPIRLLSEVAPRLLWRFLWGAGVGSLRGVARFERRRRRGEPYFPAFVFVSVTNRCNLSCRGCWVCQTPPSDMSSALLNHIVAAARDQGCRFFGLLGGEPLLTPAWQQTARSFRDCYFQLFTNGVTLDDAAARRLAALGNVTPLISIEGGPAANAERRGSEGAHAAALRALECCRRARLVTGVATSVCRSSFDDVVSTAFLDDLIARGVHYLWYYIFRPAGADPAVEEALDAGRIARLRDFIVRQRGRRHIVIVDAYWDDQGRALCPAATGISIHINALGDIEPCPPVQFADRRAAVGQPLAPAVAGSPFLTAFRREVPAFTRGCILLDHPAALAPLVEQNGARDTSGRPGNLESITARAPLPGHDIPGPPQRERQWLYRWAKRHWFFGFGAYG